eukprot:1188312-Lingulodinium_polyedra.AAC.1
MPQAVSGSGNGSDPLDEACRCPALAQVVGDLGEALDVTSRGLRSESPHRGRGVEDALHEDP